jgi:hypothetical protein
MIFDKRVFIKNAENLLAAFQNLLHKVIHSKFTFLITKWGWAKRALGL